MKCMMEIKQRMISFDVENSIASLLGFRKKNINKYISQKIIHSMGFNTIYIQVLLYLELMVMIQTYYATLIY